MISRYFVLTAGFIAFFGCSQQQVGFDRVAVQGSVTLGGKPLTAGTIRFVPAAGVAGPKVSLAVQEGQFKSDALNGPTLGLHRVEIELAASDEYAHDDEAVLVQLEAKGARHIIAPKLLATYNVNSSLTAKIEAANMQPLQFELRSK